MDIPGSSSFNNQPSLTNPLNAAESVRGQQTPAQQESEVAETTVQSEQAPTTLSTNDVVNQTVELNASTVGKNVDTYA